MNGLNPMVLSRLSDAKREIEAAMKSEGCDELFQDHIQRSMTFLREVQGMCDPKQPVYRTNVKEFEPEDRRSRE